MNSEFGKRSRLLRDFQFGQNLPKTLADGKRQSPLVFGIDDRLSQHYAKASLHEPKTANRNPQTENRKLIIKFSIFCFC
ncbi:MAG: hypothetical protein MUD08_01495 [Cytophagales bacterium]|nr:hypothetical protein [Cytophagales bacterium]